LIDESRTTGKGLFNYAHSYFSSATALEAVKVNATHRNAPVYYLYYHAIELYLKAHLLAHGTTVQELVSQYSHRICKIADEAKRNGLTLRDTDEEIIKYMGETNAVIETRYIVTGSKVLPLFSSLQNTCLYLHQTIEPSVKESFHTND